MGQVSILPLHTRTSTGKFYQQMHVHCLNAIYIRASYAYDPCRFLSGGAAPRWQKSIPDICNYLGWCTWDAFYHDVSARGVVGGLRSFESVGVTPRWIIIDDGWQVDTGSNTSPNK
eukprot:GHUV01041902.1.p1 GENE.GHUV01041902.1~~GHUV01041902.1.p1  ORF type:complete len:116 (-),score=1.40 GHUV01041902.1:323-670(-)